MLTDRTISIGQKGSSFADSRQVSILAPPNTLVLSGEYDTANAGALWAEVARAIEADDADLVLHLGAVTFLDASTLSVFIRAKALLEREGRCFSLSTLSPAAVRMIEICGLQSLLVGRAGTAPQS